MTEGQSTLGIDCLGNSNLGAWLFHSEATDSADPWYGRHEGSVRLRPFDLGTTAISVGCPGMCPSKTQNISLLLRWLFSLSLVRAVLKIGEFRFISHTLVLSKFLFLDDVIIASQAED